MPKKLLICPFCGFKALKERDLLHFYLSHKCAYEQLNKKAPPHIMEGHELEKMTNQQRLDYERTLTAAALKNHPLASTFGKVKVTNYKTSQSDLTWATKKKPKG